VTLLNKDSGKARDITRVTVLGTGVLGSQIAYQAAYSGFDVTAYDISTEILESAKLRFQELASRYEQGAGGAASGRAGDALARIAYSSDLAEAAQDADLVIEAVPERLDLKREVYTKLGQAAPARTIFATNSSTLLPSAMADFTGRPDRFLALHFADPIRITKFVEVMGHAGTNSSIYQATVDFARRIGMEPIELTKEQPGYILNSLLVPFVKAGLELLVDGVAEPEMIDKVWRIFARAPEGPFQMIDRIGLNTAANVSALGDEKAQAIGRYLKENFIDRGKLGVATGEGFYKYSTAT
jgi:3-hydroxybutyryl-CoA dehydrogenase